MTDFSRAVLSLREPMTRAPGLHPRAEGLLAKRAAVFSSSPLSNPVLAVSELTGWPDQELLARLEREPARRNMGVSPVAYFQLAFPVDAAPTDLPEGVTLLGYDVTDGTDSYLLDYGVLPPPVAVPEDRLNEVGLLDGREAATGLAGALVREWGLGSDGEPQVWALFHVDVPR